MTTGTMVTKRGDMRVRVEISYYDGVDAVAVALDTPLAGRRMQFSPDVWRFEADTPAVKADTPTNLETYASLTPGDTFDVHLVADKQDFIGHRMKVNERWYVDRIGNLEPKAMPIAHLVDSKFTIKIPQKGGA